MVFKIPREPAEVAQAIETAADNALKTALDSVRQLPQTRVNAMKAAALQYSKSADPNARAFGGIAYRLLQKGNREDDTGGGHGKAELALGFAETAMKISEAAKTFGKGTARGPEKAREQGAWIGKFNEVSEQAIAAFRENTPLDVQGAWQFLVSVNAIQAETERRDSLERLGRSENGFVRSSAAAIQTLRPDNAAAAANMLQFYNDKMVSARGLRDGDGQVEIAAAIGLQIHGRAEEAAPKLKEGLERYSRAVACVALLASTAEEEKAMRAGGFKTSLAMGMPLEAARKALEARDLGLARAKLGEYFDAKAVLMGRKQDEALAKAGQDLKPAIPVMEGMKETLLNYARYFGYEVRTLTGKVEGAEALHAQIIGDLSRIRGSKNDSERQKAVAGLQQKMDQFATAMKDLLATVPTATFLMNQVLTEQNFARVLKTEMNLDQRTFVKKEVLRLGQEAESHFRQALDALLDGKTKAMDDAFRKGVENKVEILGWLGIKKGTGIAGDAAAFADNREKKPEFGYFGQELEALYERMKQGEGATASSARLLEVTTKFETCLRSSQDKAIASGEYQLQQGFIAEARRLMGHYSGRAPMDAAQLAAAQKNMEYDHRELRRLIKNADRVYQAGEAVLSFVHPAVLFSVAFRGLTEEYQKTEHVSWTSALMLTASTLAFRHSDLMKTTLAGFGRSAAGHALSLAELGMGGYLAVHGVVSTYRAFREGEYFDGTLGLAMGLAPAFHARTAIAQGTKRTYRSVADFVINDIPAKWDGMRLLTVQELKAFSLGALQGAKQGWKSSMGRLYSGPGQIYEVISAALTEGVQAVRDARKGLVEPQEFANAMQRSGWRDREVRYLLAQPEKSDPAFMALVRQNLPVISIEGRMYFIAGQEMEGAVAYRRAGGNLNRISSDVGEIPSKGQAISDLADRVKGMSKEERTAWGEEWGRKNFGEKRWKEMKKKMQEDDRARQQRKGLPAAEAGSPATAPGGKVIPFLDPKKEEAAGGGREGQRPGKAWELLETARNLPREEAEAQIRESFRRMKEEGKFAEAEARHQQGMGLHERPTEILPVVENESRIVVFDRTAAMPRPVKEGSFEPMLERYKPRALKDVVEMLEDASGVARDPESVAKLQGRLPESFSGLLKSDPDVMLPKEYLRMETLDGAVDYRFGGFFEDASGRRMIPMYVTNAAGETRVAIAYQSKSQASWRILLDVTAEHYGKGSRGEHAYTLPFEVQQALDKLNRRSIGAELKIIEPGKIVTSLSQEELRDFVTHRERIDQHGKEVKAIEGTLWFGEGKLPVEKAPEPRWVRPEIDFDAVRRFFNDLEAHENGALMPFLKGTMENGGKSYQPADLIAFSAAHSPEYGVFVRAAVPSRNGQMRYVFNVTAEGTFFSAIENTRGSINKYGLNQDPVVTGFPEAIMTPLIEYERQIPKGMKAVKSVGRYIKIDFTQPMPILDDARAFFKPLEARVKTANAEAGISPQ